MRHHAAVRWCRTDGRGVELLAMSVASAVISTASAASSPRRLHLLYHLLTPAVRHSGCSSAAASLFARACQSACRSFRRASLRRSCIGEGARLRWWPERSHRPGGPRLPDRRGVGDHSEGLDLCAARLAGREVRSAARGCLDQGNGACRCSGARSCSSPSLRDCVDAEVDLTHSLEAVVDQILGIAIGGLELPATSPRNVLRSSEATASPAARLQVVQRLGTVMRMANGRPPCEPGSQCSLKSSSRFDPPLGAPVMAVALHMAATSRPGRSRSWFRCRNERRLPG